MIAEVVEVAAMGMAALVQQARTVTAKVVKMAAKTDTGQTASVG